MVLVSHAPQYGTRAARGVDGAQVLGGLAMIVCVLLATFGTAFAYGKATGSSPFSPRAIEDEPAALDPTEPEVVEAGFVQLGRAWDPRALPDRRIQSNAQAPRAQDPDVVSPFQRLTQDAGVRPANTAVTALLDTTASYDQDGEARMLFEQEGEAWGSDRPRAGNMLLGQLDALMRRGLEVPPNLPESEFGRTVARVRIVVGADWSIDSIQFATGSGVDDWDRVVRRRVDEIASSLPRLSPCPGEEASLNQPITLNVKPRAARRRAPGAGASGASGSPFGRLLE